MEIILKEQRGVITRSPIRTLQSGWLPGYNIRKIWHPSWFQGSRPAGLEIIGDPGIIYSYLQD